MTRSRKYVVGVALIAMLQSVVLLSMFGAVELAYVGPNSIQPALRCAAAILWFPVGYLPDARVTCDAAVPPLVRILILAVANGIAWGAALVALWVSISTGIRRARERHNRSRKG